MNAYLSRFSLLIVFACLIFAPSLYAGQQSQAGVDPRADQVIKQMSRYLDTLGQFTIHLKNTEDRLTPSGRKVQYESTVDVLVRRPDRLRADIKGDDRLQQFFYDGENLILFGKDKGLYSAAQAPDTLEAALDMAREEYGIVVPAADMVANHAYEILMENVTYGEYLGLHTVSGIPCHHLLFSQDEVDWQLWVEDSKTPVPRKMVITERLVAGGPQFTAHFLNWNLSADLPDEYFIFLPPELAEKIEFVPAETENN